MIVSVDLVRHTARTFAPATLDCVRDAQRRDVPGRLFCRHVGSGEFTSRPIPAPRFMRFGHVAAWESEAALEAHRPPFGDGVERFHARLQPVKCSGDWNGFAPGTEDAEPLRDDEPVVVMIQGYLRARHAVEFWKANAQVVAQTRRSPGYLGGVGLADTPMATISFSFWRTYAESKRFAYGAGPHAPAMRASRTVPWHRNGAEGLFARFRPLRIEGSFSGSGQPPWVGEIATMVRPAPEPARSAAA